MNIQPVTIWANGQEQQANIFTINVEFDNLIDFANFNYNIFYINDLDILQIATYGKLKIQGQDYQDWNISNNANQWAYEWAAAQLNLVLIPETV
jgi:hypothetical protein